MSTGHFFGAESRVEAQRLFEGDLHSLSFGAGRVVVDRGGLRRLIEELEGYELLVRTMWENPGKLIVADDGVRVQR